MKSFALFFLLLIFSSAAAVYDRSFYCKKGGCVKRIVSESKGLRANRAFACIGSDGSQSNTRYPRDDNLERQARLRRRGWSPAPLCADEI